MTLEGQLWLLLDDAEARVDQLASQARDQVVRVLPYEVREGREAREAGVVEKSSSSKLQ